jgi:hypothetical protein
VGREEEGGSSEEEGGSSEEEGGSSESLRENTVNNLLRFSQSWGTSRVNLALVVKTEIY